MKTYIVTGGAGFIGSHIARLLQSAGNQIIILDNLSTGKEENIPTGAEFIKIDLGYDDVNKYLKNINAEAIFHLAGQSSGEASFLDPWYDFHSHVISTFHLLEFCKNRNIKRFLYASSMSVYGDPCYLPVDEPHPLQPKTYYAAAKCSAEAYLKFYQTLGINTTVFRMFSVYGPGQNLGNKMQGMASIFFSYMLEGIPVIVKGSKDRFRDFVYIDDVARAWLAALNAPTSYGKTYNLSSGTGTTVEILLETLKESFALKEYPIHFTEGTPGDQHGMVGDIALIKRDLGWTADVDLRTGLTNMVEFEKDH